MKLHRSNRIIHVRKPRLALYGGALAMLYFVLTAQHWTASSTRQQQKEAHGPSSEAIAAQRYVDSFQSLGKSLEFFHIPKTAGTAVEQAAGQQASLAWGSCAFPHRPKRSICSYPSGNDWPPHIGWWHIPAFLFPMKQDDHTLVQPYTKELFGIIRHPLDRMVSEFHYICTLKVFDWRPDQCNRSRLTEASYMNGWIQNKLRHQQDDDTTYLRDNGHFSSQYDFVFGPHQVRMLDYVVRMEDLETTFPKLMNAFATNLQLEHHNALGASQRKSSTATTASLDNETVRMIRELYSQDFVIGGYD